MCATGECSECQVLRDMEETPTGTLPAPAVPAPRCKHLMCKRTPTTTTIACPNCGRAYNCCAGHGGEAAARRSLKSHNGLVHPKKAAT